jgi:hypothetical protein
MINNLLEKNPVYNKKYMIIAVSLLIAEFTARNNFGAARQESDPQSAILHIVCREAEHRQIKFCML